MLYISGMLNPIDYAIIKFVDLLPKSTLARIEDVAEQQKFRQGEHIERYGETATQLSIIRSGLVRLGLDGADGSRFNLSILGPGSSFGETALFLDLPVQFDAHCETDVTLTALSKLDADKLLDREPAFARAALHVACARSHAMFNYIGNTRNLPLQARTAMLLVQMLDEASDGHTIYCRQADLAHALGVSRVSTGKALKALESLGLIKRAYGKILVPAKSHLESWLSQDSK